MCTNWFWVHLYCNASKLSYPPVLIIVKTVLSEYLCHVYVRNDNLSAVVIADTEYPQRVCFTLLDKVGIQTCK